jgi:hypothetical protein
MFFLSLVADFFIFKLIISSWIIEKNVSSKSEAVLKQDLTI